MGPHEITSSKRTDTQSTPSALRLSEGTSIGAMARVTDATDLLNEAIRRRVFRSLLNSGWWHDREQNP